MNKRKTALTCMMLTVAFGLSLFFLKPAFSPGQQGKKFSSHGAIKAAGLGVYSDSSLNTALSSINWGMLEPGMSQNFSCYIRNEGSNAVVLAFSTANWNPQTASEFITLSWDYAGGRINPSEVIRVTFTLSISENVSGAIDFDFVTVISSTAS